VPPDTGLQKRANFSTLIVGLAPVPGLITRATCKAGSSTNRSDIHYDVKAWLGHCYNLGRRGVIQINTLDWGNRKIAQFSHLWGEVKARTFHLSLQCCLFSKLFGKYYTACNLTTSYSLARLLAVSQKVGHADDRVSTVAAVILPFHAGRMPEKTFSQTQWLNKNVTYGNFCHIGLWNSETEHTLLRLNNKYMTLHSKVMTHKQRTVSLSFSLSLSLSFFLEEWSHSQTSDSLGVSLLLFLALPFFSHSKIPSTERRYLFTHNLYFAPFLASDTGCKSESPGGRFFFNLGTFSLTATQNPTLLFYLDRWQRISEAP
jgi:hypothetical protein